MRWLTGHKKDVRAVAYAPDGRLVSGGSDGTVRVWDAVSGECTTVVKAKAPAYAVAVSPDGQTLAYGGRCARGAESNFVYLCGLDGKPVGRRELPVRIGVPEQVPDKPWGFHTVTRPGPQSFWSLAYSGDGLCLAAACRRMGGGNIPNGGGGVCWIHNSAGGYGIYPLIGDDTYALAFAPTGRRLALTKRNNVCFYDPEGRSPVLIYRTTADWSAGVAFVPGRDLAAVASGGCLYFVNPARQEKKPQRVRAGLRIVTGIAASPDGRTVLAGGKPGTVEVYDTATRTRTATFDFGVGGVHALAFAPDGLTFAVAGDTGLVVCDAPE